MNTYSHDQKTKFIEDRDKFLTGLAATNPDNFLYMFRNAFGKKQPSGAEECRRLPPSVPPAAGRAGIDSGLSMEGIRTDYWSWGKGFISAYPPDQFIKLEKGATYGGSEAQVWVPYCTLHKIMAGLMNVCETYRRYSVYLDVTLK